MVKTPLVTLSNVDKEDLRLNQSSLSKGLGKANESQRRASTINEPVVKVALEESKIPPPTMHNNKRFLDEFKNGGHRKQPNMVQFNSTGEPIGQRLESSVTPVENKAQF